MTIETTSHKLCTCMAGLPYVAAHVCEVSQLHEMSAGRPRTGKAGDPLWLVNVCNLNLVGHHPFLKKGVILIIIIIIYD